MFREEESYPDNGQRANFVFMGYPYRPPLPKDDYGTVVKQLQEELPVRFWYFLDEVSTAEMMRKVWRAILRSDLSVFDVSGGNANVSFELGLAVAKDRRCITMLKNGEPNPLGSADLGYAERMEYTSAVSLREKLREFVLAKNSGLRKLDAISYEITADDGSTNRDEVLKGLTSLVGKIFNGKSIAMSGAKTIMGSQSLAVAALQALRSADIVKIEGSKRGSKYVFTDKWVYHDHEVSGDV